MEVRPEIQDMLDLVLLGVLGSLVAAVRDTAPFATLQEARRHLALGLNALESQETLPPHQQDCESCRSMLVQMAVTSLKAVCNLYPDADTWVRVHREPPSGQAAPRANYTNYPSKEVP